MHALQKKGKLSPSMMDSDRDINHLSWVRVTHESLLIHHEPYDIHRIECYKGGRGVIPRNDESIRYVEDAFLFGHKINKN